MGHDCVLSTPAGPRERSWAYCVLTGRRSPQGCVGVSLGVFSCAGLGGTLFCAMRVSSLRPRADPPAVLAPGWEASGPSQERAVCRLAPHAGGGPDLWPWGPTLTPEAGLARSVLCTSDTLLHPCLRQLHLSRRAQHPAHGADPWGCCSDGGSSSCGLSPGGGTGVTGVNGCRDARRVEDPKGAAGRPRGSRHHTRGWTDRGQTWSYQDLRARVTGGATWRIRATARGAGGRGRGGGSPLGHQRLWWPDTSQKPTDMGALDKPAGLSPPELGPQKVRNGCEGTQGQDCPGRSHILMTKLTRYWDSGPRHELGALKPRTFHFFIWRSGIQNQFHGAGIEVSAGLYSYKDTSSIGRGLPIWPHIDHFKGSLQIQPHSKVLGVRTSTCEVWRGPHLAHDIASEVLFPEQESLSGSQSNPAAVRGGGARQDVKTRRWGSLGTSQRLLPSPARGTPTSMCF